MTIREGKWACPYCDAVNRGRDLKCAGCGATRDKDVRFFLDGDAPVAAEVTDEAELRAAQSGPEWVCETCGASNEAARASCRNCGAARGGSQSREVKMVDEVAAPAALVPPGAPPTRGFFGRKSLLGCGGALLLAVLVVVGLFAYLTREHESRLTVTGAEWQRTVEVEELQTLTEQSWADEVPRDSRVVSRRRELHHNDRVRAGTRSVEQPYTERVQTGTRRVKVGTRDLGNGYFEDVYRDEPVYETRRRTRTVEEPVYREVPVYKDKVTYTVERWRPVKTERLQRLDNAPAWPQVGAGGRRREGKRTEKYVVKLKDPQSGKTFEREVKPEEFPRFTPGASARGKISNMGNLSELSPP